jgi:hypothetical protein
LYRDRVIRRINLQPNNRTDKKEMKPYAFLATIVAVSAFLCVVTAIEAPRKPEREKVYVLPRVEEMKVDPTPFSL